MKMKITCEPEIVGAETEYDGRGYDGEPEYSTTYEYNCHSCCDDECPHWSDFHFTKD